MDASSDGSPSPAKRKNPHPPALEAKRRKADTDAAEDSGDDDAEFDALQRDAPAIRHALVRGADSYVVGSILRVCLTNFLTYDYTEFRPGPYLNMIIGPNGTGKSAIVCAMALGLGWAPKILGRANTISDFVKNDAKSGASVEIELKDYNDKTVTIKRMFRKEDKKSKWLLNGKQANYQDIAQKVAELGVQIGNLCSFLPQDKVASFAQMTGQQLLGETMAAAGDPGLTGWHRTLMEEGGKFEQVKEEREALETKMAGVERRIGGLQATVDLQNRRKELEAEITKLERLKPIKAYLAKETDQKAAKELVNRKKQHLERLRERFQPVRDLQRHLRDKERAAQRAIERANDEASKSHVPLQNVASKLEREAEHSLEIANDMLALKETEKKRRRDIEAKKQEMQAVREDLKNKPKNDAGPALSRKLDDLRLEVNEWKHKKNEAQDRTADEQRRATVLQRQLVAAQSKADELRSAEKRRAHNLATVDSSFGYAWQWIHANKAKFEHLPVVPAVSLEIPPALANMVEGSLNRTHLAMFICKTEADYQLLNQLNDREHYVQGGGRRQRVRISAFLASAAGVNAQVDHDQALTARIQHLGGVWALDECRGTPEMIAYLRERANLADVALFPGNADEHAIEQTGVLQYATPTSSTQVRISRYGAKAKQSTTKTLSPAKFLKDSIDEKALAEVQEETARINAEKQEIERNVKAETETIDKCMREMEKVKQRAAKVSDEKRALEMANKAYEKLKIRQQNLATDIRELETRPNEQIQRKHLAKKLFASISKRCNEVSRFDDLCGRSHGAVDSAIEASLQVLQVVHDVSYVDTEVAKRDASIQPAEEAVQEAQERYQRVKQSTKAARQQLEASMATYTQGERDELVAMGQDPNSGDMASLEAKLLELGKDLELEKAKGTDPRAEEQLKAAQADQAQYTRELEAITRQYERLDGKMEEAKKRFEPALQNLIAVVRSKFSRSFERESSRGRSDLVLINRHFQRLDVLATSASYVTRITPVGPSRSLSSSAMAKSFRCLRRRGSLVV